MQEFSKFYWFFNACALPKLWLALKSIT